MAFNIIFFTINLNTEPLRFHFSRFRLNVEASRFPMSMNKFLQSYNSPVLNFNSCFDVLSSKRF